jgi:hypothetical protein
VASARVDGRFLDSAKYGKRKSKGVNMLQKSPMYAYIPAKDVARARKFYEKTLGLKARKNTRAG